LIDDEPALVKGLKLSLEQESYSVTTAGDGESGLRLFRETHPDLVLLDVMLPGKDGITVCREIRSESDVPIIMLTARGNTTDRVVGLEVGADDYVPKPFDTRELVARIRALMRRTSKQIHREQLRSGVIMVDLKNRRVKVGDHPIELTAKEYDLLVKLMASPGQVFSREQLLEDIWGFDFLGDSRTVDVHMRRLREKLEPDPANPTYLLTRRGAGYNFREDNP
jgi:DNA-binding response OmpR family regulator